jgi:hypothetical protein
MYATDHSTYTDTSGGFPRRRITRGSFFLVNVSSPSVDKLTLDDDRPTPSSSSNELFWSPVFASSFFWSSPTVLLLPIISLVVLAVSFVASKLEFVVGTGLLSLFRFRSVMELGGMGRKDREEDDVTKEADTSKDAKIVVARSSHGSVELGNEGLPPRRFLVAASS